MIQSERRPLAEAVRYEVGRNARGLELRHTVEVPVTRNERLNILYIS